MRLEPRITDSRMAMMANTSRMWINPPAEYTKNPSNQPMIRITAMI